MTSLDKLACGLIVLGFTGLSILLVRDLDRSKASKVTHYFICEEMTKAVAVYGEPKVEGAYLRIKLSPAETSTILVGPDCFIVPNVKEIE